ncbi:hypothetical protein AAC387_Pa03g3042 [Persea americana]
MTIRVGKASTVQINKPWSSHQDKRGLEHRGPRTESHITMSATSPSIPRQRELFAGPPAIAKSAHVSTVGHGTHTPLRTSTSSKPIARSKKPHLPIHAPPRVSPNTCQRIHVKVSKAHCRTSDQTGDSPLHKPTRVTLDAKPPLPHFPFIGSNCLRLSSR